MDVPGEVTDSAPSIVLVDLHSSVAGGRAVRQSHWDTKLRPRAYDVDRTGVVVVVVVYAGLVVVGVSAPILHLTVTKKFLISVTAKYTIRMIMVCKHTNIYHADE